MDEETLNAFALIACAIAHHARGKSGPDTKLWRNRLDENTSWINSQKAEYQKNYNDLKGGEIVYGHEFMSAFEEASETLKSLKIMKEFDGYYSIIIAEPEQDYPLAKANWSGSPSFEELLATFVALFGDFGTDFYGFGIVIGTTFTPKVPVLASAMAALVPLGYAEAFDGGFRWTEKIRGYWPIE